MERSIASSGIHSQVENRLRSQIFHMILAENEYRRLELEASRLARLLSSDQGMYFSSPRFPLRKLLVRVKFSWLEGHWDG